MKNLIAIIIVLIIFVLIWDGIIPIPIDFSTFEPIHYVALALGVLAFIWLILLLTGNLDKPLFTIKRQSDGTAFYDRPFVWFILVCGLSLLGLYVVAWIGIGGLSVLKDWLHYNWKGLFMLPWALGALLWVSYLLIKGIVIGKGK